MTIDGGSVGAPSPGLQLLLERLWRQESTHEHVLAELFHKTELARVLGLWARDSRPGVVVEPDRGIFDLALLDEAGTARLYIELKFAAASGWNQRTRQRAFAEAAGADRAYILLGTSFFEIDREPGVRYLGVPELLAGLAATAADGALGELKAAYAERLVRDAAVWSGEHDPASASHVAILRLYQVCENRSVMEATADRLGSGSAPLVCLSGEPTTAGRRLIAALAASGTRLRYHGDFDPDGVAIANRIIGRAVEPWRFGTDDYLAAVASTRALDGLRGSAVDASWDPQLGSAMSAAGAVVYEEQVLDALIADLAQSDRPEGRRAAVFTPGHRPEPG